MRIEFTVRDRQGSCRDVAVTAPAGSAVRDLCPGLGGLLGAASPGELWVGPRRLAADTPLGGTGLRCGDVVSLEAGGTAERALGAVLRLQVVGGPDAGQVVILPRGIVTIGRHDECDLTLTDPDVSRRHASVTVTSMGVVVRDLGSTNGTSVDGHAVDEDGTALVPGAVLRMGDSFVSLCATGEAPAAVRASPGGELLVNRPPRERPTVATSEVQFPVRGSGHPPQRMQWIAAAVPALAGIGLAVALHSPQFLIFALMSPVIVIATSLGDRLHWRRSRRRDATTFGRLESSARASVRAGLAHEVALRRRAAPDPATVHDIATAPGVRLWERHRGDADAFTVRLGLTDLPSALQARRGAEAAPAGRVSDVPIGVDLRAGPLGVAAPAGIGAGVARWLVCQLAVLHSPADLEVALLLCDDIQATWLWARWLPHVHDRTAVTSDERQSLVADLLSLVERRSAARRHERDGWAGPWLVLVIDRAGALIEQPGLSRVLAEGPTVGITAICVDDHERRLPASCAASALACGETGTRLRTQGAESTRVGDLVADRVGWGWADRVARALAPLTDAGRDAGAALPSECRLVDLLGIEAFDVTQLVERWGLDDGSASALLGMGVDGPVHVDLVADGPHALVAGTTGSGKSELLQSLVAGLAVAHPPEALSFVLVDYKGGAAFADCARLPHTVGVVTDLDAQLTGRALGSLHAELARRERLFAQVGAYDLASYRTAGPPPEALGRLVLVVDEFAALADELPDFVSGLVAIAQRGRSLGVHLVLATQRPGGVVSPEIRANTTLRVALRVADPAESVDVIGTDRAAHLGRDTPGRAVVRAGDTCTELQTARVGGPAPLGAGPEVSIAPLGCWRRALPGASPSDTDSAAKTDLQLLVDALREAATVSGRAAPRRPWLAPLPTQLRLADVPRAAFATSVAFGLLDDPRQQRQPPVELDLEAGGSVLFTGGPRSGRSTALVTIAAAAAHQLAPHELAVYAIDCAGGSLRAISDLPHCGTAAARDAFDLAASLARRLEAEVIRRQAWLAAHGASSVAEARAGGHPIPLILCLLDGWEAFVAAADEHDSGHTVDVLVRLVRTAPAAGMTVLLAGDRNTLAARLGSAVATKFVLGLSERADYALAGIAARAVPLNMPAGRAIRAADAAEVQIAFVGAAPSPSEQAGFVGAVANAPRVDVEVRRPHAGMGPSRLRSLPSRIALDALNPTPGRFTIGAGGDAAEAVSVDLFAGAGRLLVAGPARSGRSSALHTLLVQAVREGVAVVVAAPRRSPLVSAAEYHGIAVVAPDAAPRAAGLPAHPRTLLLVDDSEAFLDTVVGDALAASVRAAPAALAAVVASNSDDLALTYRGVAAEVRRSRCALVLAPGPGDGDLIGRRLPRRHGPMPPGRGVLVGDRAWGTEFAEPVPIQVAVS